MEYTREQIEEIKNTTDLCDTFCCYENCPQCVEKYIAYQDNKKLSKQLVITRK